MNLQLLSCGAVEAEIHIPVSTRAMVSDEAGPAGGAGGGESAPRRVASVDCGAALPSTLSQPQMSIIIPTRQTGTLRLRGVQGLASGHTARTWQGRA